MRQYNVINALEPVPLDYHGYSALSQVYRNNISDGAPFTMDAGSFLDGILIEKNTALSRITFTVPTNSIGITIRRNTTSTGATTPVVLDSPAEIIP